MALKTSVTFSPQGRVLLCPFLGAPMIVPAPLCALIAFEIVIASYSKLISTSSVAKYSAGLSPRLDRTIKSSYISTLDSALDFLALLYRNSLVLRSSSSLKAGLLGIT